MLKKISALCGLIGPLLVVALIFYAVSLAPWFSWTENALSDLGVDEKACLPFNFALILGGFLYAVFVLGLGALLQKKLFNKLGLSVMFLDAVVLCALGIFPENVKPWHYWASVAFFAFIPLSQLLMSIVFLNKKQKRLGLFSVLSGLITAMVWTYPWKAVGIPEIVAGSMLAVWVVTLSLRMYKRLE